ncbi:F0F1 ATP synthase subunit B [Methylovulum psychrotolerans]|uniref:F0F1 ATP synthase subunit B family protein n=1 Tax=Methylovulum psychrotolerans TaxID=1704499 RepID=UPI001BFF1DE5|nr:F0F1 ATP synthase subunit B [Methylovulum psychrotolerans]MBT9100411.1 F0F1 ATP synthase subunit B [Methylovulum psychrotolerans]
MLIDWFTVGAQTLNFLLLVGLMKRFLYRPILQAIDEREKRIAAELSAAAAKMAQAQQQYDEFQHNNQVFGQERAQRLQQAVADAEAERQRLMTAARQAADTLSAQRLESLRSEAQNLHQAIRQRTQQEVFAIARKTLADLAETGLEERLGELFIRRLRALAGQDKAVLAQACQSAAEPALLRSAVALPEAQRVALQQAVNETFSAQVPLQFVTAPDLVSGLELSVNGQKVAWSIDDYLTSLEQAVAALLPNADAPETQPQPNANEQGS